MPIATSYADVIKDWEGLLAAALEHALSLPETERARIAFQEHLAKIKEMKARQDSFTAARQETTQLLKKLVEEGRDLASRLRAMVKAGLGLKSERLVQFGIAPIRKRAPRKTDTKPPNGTPAPETSTPEEAPAPPVTRPAA